MSNRVALTAAQVIEIWEGGPRQYDHEEYDAAMNELKWALYDLDHPAVTAELSEIAERAKTSELSETQERAVPDESSEAEERAVTPEPPTTKERDK